jgi:hypothetical protein
VHDPFDEYKNCKTTGTTPSENNKRPDLRHVFKKTGATHTVTGTRGKQHGIQQQQECRVIRNGAGNTATQVNIHRSETHNL